MGEIDKSVNTYQYLKAFESWWKEKLAINTRICRYFYPAVLLVSFLGTNDEPITFYLVDGVPTLPLLGITIFAGLSSLFAGPISTFDVNLVYGRVFKRLDAIIADMEELRS